MIILCSTHLYGVLGLLLWKSGLWSFRDGLVFAVTFSSVRSITGTYNRYPVLGYFRVSVSYRITMRDNTPYSQ